MRDIIISVVEPFGAPMAQANFVVFKNDRAVVPMREGSAYFKRCKDYAQEHRCHLVTSLMNIGDYLCLCMFSPKGKVAGGQRALFLAKENRGIFRKCSDLSSFETPYGKVALCVDADIYNPEVQRAARIDGCSYVVCSQFLPDYSEHKLLCGGWGAAQTNNLLVICANNRTAAICAPYVATPDNSGYLARPAQTASTAFNVSRLSGIHSEYMSSHFNRELFAGQKSLL